MVLSSWQASSGLCVLIGGFKGSREGHRPTPKMQKVALCPNHYGLENDAI